MNTFDWKDKKFIVGERFKELRESLDRINGKCTQKELAKELALIAEWDRKQLAKAKNGPGLVQFMVDWLQQPAGGE